MGSRCVWCGIQALDNQDVAWLKVSLKHLPDMRLG